MRHPSSPFWLDQKVEDNDTSRAAFGIVYNTVGINAEGNPPIWGAGTNAVIGFDGADEWTYLPCDFNGSIHTATAIRTISESNPVQLAYTICFANGSRMSYPETNVPTSGIFLPGTTDQPCWLRVDSVRTLTGTGRLAFVPVAGARILAPAYSPPQVEVSTAPYTATRCTALTLLATNVSRVQIKQGTIKGARFSSLKPAFWSPVPGDVDGVHPAERYYGACENGLYMVAPPTQDSELFIQSVRTKQSLLSLSTTGSPTFNLAYRNVPVVNFDTDDPFLAAFIEEQPTVDETLMALTVDIHLEFRTSSPLFQVGISSIPLETYHASQLVVAQAGFFYENSTHWLQLAGRIAALASKVIPLVLPGTRLARVATAASMLLPALAPRRNMTQKQMVKPPQQTQQRRRARKKVKVQRRKR